MKKILIISIICLIVDQLLKLLITINFDLYQGFVFIPSFFSIIRVHNTGAAWSILSGNNFLLSLLSLLGIVIIYIMFIKNNKFNRIEQSVYGVLIGGILGNLVDRVFRGYVVDYFDFNIFGYNFPVFNFADVCIVISALILLLLQIGGKNDEENKNN